MEKKVFEIYNSKTDTFFSTDNLAKFCREYDLPEISMRDVVSGRCNQHQGYFAKIKGSNKDLIEIYKKTIKSEKLPKQKIPKKTRYNQSDEYFDFIQNINYYHQLYHIEQKMSCNDIGKKLGVDGEMIRRNFSNHNLPRINNKKIKIRESIPAWRNLNQDQKNFLDHFEILFPPLHYDLNLSIEDISNKYMLSKATIFNYCRKHNLKYKNSNISKPHQMILSWLTNHNIKYETNNRKLIKPKELDIYLPEHNLAIEINGLYWHSERKLGKTQHITKHNICQTKGINLVQFYDVEVLEKFNIVCSILSTKLGLVQNKIGARQTKLIPITYKKASIFLENNHIQGTRTTSINYGLFFGEELVSVATFNKHKKYGYELIRLCNKTNTIISGGANKLLSKFLLDYNPIGLVSYCDKRLFYGGVYHNLGFLEKEDSSPNYHYFNDRQYKLLSRVAFQKHLLPKKLSKFDPEKTEYENMLDNGYDRIWDCGNKVFYMDQKSKK